MSEKSSIEWTDATWNPVTGCTKVSAGCAHCYAETFAERWRGVPGHHFEKGFDMVLRPDKLDLPLRWKKPRRIFVTSMGDLFHKDVPDGFIFQVFTVMASCPHHTFQLLTKRPERMRALLNHPDFWGSLAASLRVNRLRGMVPGDPELGDIKLPLPNVWLGTSVEDQASADLRVPELTATPAAIRFLSCEPLLGQVDLVKHLSMPYHDCQGSQSFLPTTLIHWVIAGGESGPGARAMHPDWVRLVQCVCQMAGVPFFFKQWGGVQKSRAGRMLDGRTWDEFPGGGSK